MEDVEDTMEPSSHTKLAWYEMVVSPRLPSTWSAVTTNLLVVAVLFCL